MTTAKTLLIALLSIGSTALAQEPMSEEQTVTEYDRGPAPANDHFSELTGRTVGNGNFIVHPEVGFPAVSVTLLSGMRDRYDFGGRFTVGYSAQALSVSRPLNEFNRATSLGAQAVMRWNFVDGEYVSFGGRLEPGVLFGVTRDAAATLVLPFGLDLGFHPHRVVSIAIGGDVGVGAVVNYTGGASFILPVSAGPGLEFNISDAVQLTLNSRFGGVSFRAPTSPLGGDFGFRASIGLAFRT